MRGSYAKVLTSEPGTCGSCKHFRRDFLADGTRKASGICEIKTHVWMVRQSYPACKKWVEMELIGTDMNGGIRRDRYGNVVSWGCTGEYGEPGVLEEGEVRGAVVHLPIMRRWFDKIFRGEKPEEYREIKDYWRRRFVRAGLLLPNGMPSGKIRKVIIRAGYQRGAPEMNAWCRLAIGRGREEWGAESGKVYYILKIQERERVR